MPGTFLERLTTGYFVRAMPFFDQSPPVVVPRHDEPQLFAECPERAYQMTPNVPPSGMPGTPDAAFIAGTSGNPERDFTWLPYVAGKITYARVGTKPILTGKMSGCWLVLFRIRGQLCFGHIGTDSNNRNVTEDVKNAWKVAIGRGLIQPVRAMNPAAEVGPSLNVFGALGAGQQFQAISCDPGKNAVDLIVRRVKLVQGVPNPQFA